MRDFSNKYKLAVKGDKQYRIKNGYAPDIPPTRHPFIFTAIRICSTVILGIIFLPLSKNLPEEDTRTPSLVLLNPSDALSSRELPDTFSIDPFPFPSKTFIVPNNLLGPPHHRRCPLRSLPGLSNGWMDGKIIFNPLEKKCATKINTYFMFSTDNRKYTRVLLN